jgi:formate dehydrogenase major subunit
LANHYESGNTLGAGWDYWHPSDIMDEAAKLSPLYAGVGYERLEGYKSLQWPVASDGKDTPLLFTEAFPFPDGKARYFQSNGPNRLTLGMSLISM